MNVRHLRGLVCVMAVAWLTAACNPLMANERTNFLVILADDLGFSDLGCYGGEIETPNLDALAAGGLRYTQFYNTARCWPTRAALMTGYYPQQVRRDSMPGATRHYGGGGKRPDWAATLAEYLRPAGYRTYHSGKWHIDGKPTDNGFDRSDEATRSPGFFDSIRKKYRDPKFYRTTATAQHAIECLQEHAEEHSDQPFFHFLAFHAPHFPLHALPEDIERYRDRYIAGWAALRKERKQRQHELGLNVGPLSPIEREVGPPYAFPDQIKVLGEGEVTRPLPWDELTEEQQRFQATKMAIHAAMVDRMDQEIGRVLAQLKEMDQFENTWVCFLSDNGASAEIMVRGEGHEPSASPGSAATYLCLGPGFSSAANTPFRRHKTWVHEGGTSTPLIVHWPQGIRAKNELRTNLGHAIDIAPTVMDLAMVEPEETAGPPMSGRSLKPSFDDSDAAIHNELWFYHEGNWALRQGDWKIIHSNISRPFPWLRSETAAGESKEDGNWQLYRLSDDRAEQNDLADKNPKRVQQMADRWWELRDQFLQDSRGDLDRSGRAN